MAHFATGVTSAKRMYERANPDLIFLDHDLGGQTYVDSDEGNTGYQFVKWLKENDPQWKERSYVVHSLNPSGADNMLAELEGAKNIWRIPFNLERFSYAIENAL
jgi:CheY-like chemotaxis protein